MELVNSEYLIRPKERTLEGVHEYLEDARKELKKVQAKKNATKDVGSLSNFSGSSSSLIGCGGSSPRVFLKRTFPLRGNSSSFFFLLLLAGSSTQLKGKSLWSNG